MTFLTILKLTAAIAMTLSTVLFKHLLALTDLMRLILGWLSINKTRSKDGPTAFAEYSLKENINKRKCNIQWKIKQQRVLYS